MKRLARIIPSLALAAATSLAASGAFADVGDAEKGERDYRKCKTCHSLEEGNNGVGPSLYGIMGRQAGTVPDYNYSDSYVVAGEQGLVWTAEALIAYLEDPKAFLVETLGTEDVTTKMRNKFRKQSTRENIAAYLLSIAPAAE